MKVFFVLNGLMNGEDGEFATTCGFGEQYRDGWYYLPKDAEEGVGPFESKKQAIEAAAPKPMLPSEWAKEGVYVVEGWTPRVGANLDYYDRNGVKRHGTVKSIDGNTITIEGQRMTTVTEVFVMRQGRY